MSTILEGRPRTASARLPRPVPRGAAPGGAVVRGALVVGCLLVVAFWWSGTPAAAGATPGGAATGAGELAGLLAAFLVCAQLLLIGRVPWFERAVGFDRLVAWHRSLGTSVVLLVLTHVALMVVGGALLDRQTPWGEAVSILTTQPEIVSAFVGTGLFVLVGATSARLARRVLSYEAWFVVHLSIYVGIYLTFGHQIAAGAHFVADPVARAVWTALYVATAAALLTWRVLVPLLAHRRMLLRVEHVVPEAPGVVSVWLQGRAVDELEARGGQFVLLRFLVRGHLTTAHPYSLSMVPTAHRLRGSHRARTCRGSRGSGGRRTASSVGWCAATAAPVLRGGRRRPCWPAGSACYRLRRRACPPAGSLRKGRTPSSTSETATTSTSSRLRCGRHISSRPRRSRRVQAAAAAVDHAARALDGAVQSARAVGVSWVDIGRAVGITPTVSPRALGPVVVPGARRPKCHNVHYRRYAVMLVR